MRFERALLASKAPFGVAPAGPALHGAHTALLTLLALWGPLRRLPGQLLSACGLSAVSFRWGWQTETGLACVVELASTSASASSCPCCASRAALRLPPTFAAAGPRTAAMASKPASQRCSHCSSSHTSRSWHRWGGHTLCAACRQYVRSRGELPPADILQRRPEKPRRQMRRSRQRLSTGAGTEGQDTPPPAQQQHPQYTSSSAPDSEPSLPLTMLAEGPQEPVAAAGLQPQVCVPRSYPSWRAGSHQPRPAQVHAAAVDDGVLGLLEQAMDVAAAAASVLTPQLAAAFAALPPLDTDRVSSAAVLVVPCVCVCCTSAASTRLQIAPLTVVLCTRIHPGFLPAAPAPPQRFLRRCRIHDNCAALRGPPAARRTMKQGAAEQQAAQRPAPCTDCTYVRAALACCCARVGGTLLLLQCGIAAGSLHSERGFIH